MNQNYGIISASSYGISFDKQFMPFLLQM